MPPTVLQQLIHPKSPVDTAGEASERGLEAAALLEMLTVVVESAPVAIAMFDREMRYIMANRQWVQEFHLEQAMPLEGRSQYEVFPKLHPGWRQVYDRALQGYVVKSDHDVLASSSGKAILFRWEVRPWRLKSDASVAGVIVTCDKFAASQEGVVAEASMPPAPGAESERGEDILDLSGCELPVFVIDPGGRVMRANQRALGLALATGVQEGSSHLWEALSPEAGRAALRHEVQNLLVERLSNRGPEGPQVLVLRKEAVETGMPSRWLIARQAGRDELVVVGLTGLSPFESVSKVGIRLATAPGEVNGKRIVPIQNGSQASVPEAKLTIVKKELAAAQEALEISRREIRTLKEVERTLLQRESQHQAVLEAFPGGLLMLSEEGVPLMHNAALEKLMGRRLGREDRVEGWLAEACPTPAHKEELQRLWREDIWRRQLTRQMTLATAAHLLREVEFQPVPLKTGGLLLHVHDVTDRDRAEEQLSAMEGKFRALVHDNPLPVILTDRLGGIYEANAAATELLNRSKAELRQLLIDDLFDADSALARKVALADLIGEDQSRCQLEVGLADRRLPRQQLTLALVRTGEVPQGALHFFQSVADAISGVVDGSTEVEKRSEAPTVTSVAVPAVLTQRRLIAAAPNGRIREWSAVAEEVFGFEASEVMGQPLHMLFRPSDASGFYQELRDRQAVEEARRVHWRYFGRDGHRGELGLEISQAPDGGVVMERLVPEAETAAAERVQKADEKRVALVPRPEWALSDWTREQALLRETHHRIRSHLQILSSLLNLQANGVTDRSARGALCSSQNRLRAIAGLHAHLETVAGGGRMNLRQVIAGLVEHLRGSFGAEASRVVLRLEIPEPLELPEEWLMPLVLTIHEAVANSLQHAYPGDGGGELTIRLVLDGTHGCLTITDNGVGFDAEEQSRVPRGLGLKVMAVFADQMRATIDIQSRPESGTSIEMQFSIAFM